MDWKNWVPTVRANLCFIRRGDEILLIRKKRGLGAGKINAPGGKLEPGETALEAVIRETQEEIHVTPLALEEMGDLHFQFSDGFALYCTVFFALDHEGEPTETEEAFPFWVPIDAIPYVEMWADDAYWLPLALTGKKFRGYFEFEEDTMLSHHIDLLDPCPAP